MGGFSRANLPGKGVFKHVQPNGGQTLSQISKRSQSFFNDSSQFHDLSASLNNMNGQNNMAFDSSSRDVTKQLFKNELLINKDVQERFNGILRSRLPLPQQTQNEAEVSGSFSANHKQPQCQLCNQEYESTSQHPEGINSSPIPLKLYCCENTICSCCLRNNTQLNQASYKFRIRCKICNTYIDGRYSTKNTSESLISFGDQFQKFADLSEDSSPQQIKMAIASAHMIDYSVIEQLEKLKFVRITHPFRQPYNP